MFVGWGPMERRRRPAGQHGAVVSSSILSNIDSVVASRTCVCRPTSCRRCRPPDRYSDAVGPPAGRPLGRLLLLLAVGARSAPACLPRVKRLIRAAADAVVDRIRRVKRFRSRRGRRPWTRTPMTRPGRTGTCLRAEPCWPPAD